MTDVEQEILDRLSRLQKAISQLQTSVNLVVFVLAIVLVKVW